MTRPPAGVTHECALGYSGWFGVQGAEATRGIAHRRIVAVGVAGADRGDRPPEGVVVLRVEAGDEGIGVVTETIAMNRDAATMSSSWSRTNLRKEPCACWTGGSAQNRAASGLLGGPRRARARAELLDLVVVACPAPAVERRRSVGPELVGRVEAERPHQAEVSANRRRGRRRDPDPGDRRVRRRIRSPEPGSRRRRARRSRAGDAVPAATPSVLAWPSGIVASEAAYAGSRIVGACAGR